MTLIELLLAAALVAVLLAIAIPSYNSIVHRNETKDATIDLKLLESRIEQFKNENFRYPDSLAELPGDLPLDPWGNPYQYLNIEDRKGKGKGKDKDKGKDKGKLRKDKNLVPINSDFDLYSKGPDGRSVSPLTAKPSHDDIVRANNGGYIGVASEY